MRRLLEDKLIGRIYKLASPLLIDSRKDPLLTPRSHLSEEKKTNLENSEKLAEEAIAIPALLEEMKNELSILHIFLTTYNESGDMSNYKQAKKKLLEALAQSSQADIKQLLEKILLTRVIAKARELSGPIHDIVREMSKIKTLDECEANRERYETEWLPNSERYEKAVRRVFDASDVQQALKGNRACKEKLESERQSISCYFSEHDPFSWAY